ncbi:MAG: AI-2E family transporter [Rhodospirillales bacterium]|nr:AI-2E family transporter [Rhodospirillales bacterium]
MTQTTRIVLWAAVVGILIAVLWLLRPVLLPFVVGTAIAYLLSPVVERLERWGWGRTLSAALAICAFFVIVGIGIVLLVPVLRTQIPGLVDRLVAAAQALYEQARPWIEMLAERAGSGDVKQIGGASDLAGKLLLWLGSVLAGFWSGGLALFNLLALIFITPIVAFYLVRDWTRIVDAVDSWLPRDQAATIREQLRLIDERISGFLYGQALVCVMVGVFYAIGLSIIGLHYGLIVGLLAGVLSFIPYVGFLVGAAIGLAIAWFQFGAWTMMAAVLAVFFVGNFIESNFVAQRLVGERVGLHPVWVILAVLAGGAVFGFVGVLLAVPIAAVIGVLLRFALQRYLRSPLYLGHGGGDGGGDGGAR